MVGLRGCRAVVVDDDEQDAMPILKALSKRGIGTAFFSGSIAELPKEGERLLGVRLAILDMDLIGGTNDKSKIAALINVLGRILHPNNGPYGILAWTKHKELVSMLDAQTLSGDIPKPVFVASMPKPDFTTGPGQYDLRRVSAKLKSELRVFSPLLFLGAWEQMSFDAASAVTNALCEISKPNAVQPEAWRNQWKVQLLQLIGAMAKAESGRHVIDSRSALLTFFRSLSPLHADRMEAALTDATKPLRTLASELLGGNAKGCGAEHRARVNTMLHLALDNVEAFEAGSVYRYPSTKTLRALLPAVDPLVRELLEVKKTPDGQPDEKRMNEIRDEVVGSSMPVLVEVNPACDHAQCNVRFARLLAGILMPVEHRKKIKEKADFIWKEGPFFVGSPADEVSERLLILSARHLVTLRIKSVARMKPLARLRSELLIALQAWLGDHASRPGVLMLR